MCNQIIFKRAMKKILLLSIWMFSGWVAMAQDPDPEIDENAQQRIKTLRIAYISDKLGLTPEQAEKFWPVYQEYSDKRRVLTQEFREARKDAKQDDPAKQEELVKLGLALKQKELDLEKDYSGRLLKIITAQQVLNLRRAEGDFQRIILQQLQQRRNIQQRNETLRERNQRLRQKN